MSEITKSFSRFYARNHHEISQLATQTHFDRTELLSCVHIYHHLLVDLGPGATHITRTQFRDVLHNSFDMSDEHLLERVQSALDRGITPLITLDTWTRTLSLFMRGTFAERLRFCFDVYDVHGDGLLRRDALLQMLRHTLGRQRQAEELDEAANDMADHLMKRMDVDEDGAISFDDYCRSVRMRPELLEVLGPCLPDRSAVNAFLTTFTTAGRF